jgi:cyclic pyranopterin phosphate synthase
MYDRFNRTINYLRISVTDRCNLRCIYCMPGEGIKLIGHNEILRYEEIVEVVKESVRLGITKVRITGGEPLVRKGITGLVGSVSQIKGVTDFSLTTNGTLLEHFASDLATAGLHRVNISLDTADPERYRQITRGGDITKVFRGIEAARLAGLSPVKINCVVKNSSDEPDAIGVKKFCNEYGLEVRFIHQMDLESGCFTVVEGGKGGDCLNCNRLRLTSNGMIKPCLFDDLEFSIRELGIREAFYKAINFKPEKGSQNLLNKFHNIGG